MGAWGAPKGATPKGFKGASKGYVAPVQKTWIKPVTVPATSSWSKGSSKGGYKSAAPATKGVFSKGAPAKGAGKSTWSAPATSWSTGKGKTSYVSSYAPAKGAGKFGSSFSPKGKGKGKFLKGAPPANSEYWTEKMAQENREVIGGTFTGTVYSYNIKFGWGFVLPDNVEELPAEAQEKIAQANEEAAAKGKEGMNLLYFRKPDIVEGVKVEKDAICTFSIYVDDKGAGACDLSC
eukprot:gb/GFBE01065774.1/.p1 GENE.gb/GFBE01065774.1/~~gb/GFBE01065774.1/.p1  ORF type:complete len:235 (+),score=79.01 gb/GFBE01065774.1/:1-705(+)